MSGRAWHTNLLIVVLVVWAIVSVARFVRAALDTQFTLYDCYFLLTPASLMALAAIMLFRRNRYRAIPLALVPLWCAVAAIRLKPVYLSWNQTGNFARFFLQFEPYMVYTGAFFLSLVIYCFFLNKMDADL